MSLSTRKEDTKMVNDEAALSSAVITMADIKKEINAALEAYSKKRFAGEPPRQHYRRDIFHKGFSANERQFSINELNSFISDEPTMLSDAQIKALRKGNLGDALRSAAQKLAKDFNKPEIATVSGLIAYIAKEHGLTNKNQNPDQNSNEKTGLKA